MQARYQTLQKRYLGFREAVARTSCNCLHKSWSMPVWNPLPGAGYGASRIAGTPPPPEVLMNDMQSVLEETPPLVAKSATNGVPALDVALFRPDTIVGDFGNRPLARVGHFVTWPGRLGSHYSGRENHMDNISIRDGLLAALTECYEADPAHFVSLPKQIVDLSMARAVIADLRNEGHVEEQERGVIRFTTRGYQAHRERPSRRDESRVLLAV